jgi:POT family proton-dependent oligopeptide transporter
MMNNFVSSASQMELHGIPVRHSSLVQPEKMGTNFRKNDLMQNIDPLTILLFIPICNNYLYPWLRRFGIALKPITRIFLGFILGSIGLAYAAYVQTLIYNAGPCFTEPLRCPAAKLPNGSIEHNHVHVAVQTPAYFFIALSEIFASITGLEYAYSQAPASMKSFIMSLFLLTTAGGALLGALVAPWAKDPTLTTLYMCLGVVSLLTGVVFWVLYGRMRDVVEEQQTSGSFDEHTSYSLAPLSEDGHALRQRDSDENKDESGQVERPLS